MSPLGLAVVQLMDEDRFLSLRIALGTGMPRPSSPLRWAALSKSPKRRAKSKQWRKTAILQWRISVPQEWRISVFDSAGTSDRLGNGQAFARCPHPSARGFAAAPGARALGWRAAAGPARSRCCFRATGHSVASAQGKSTIGGSA